MILGVLVSARFRQPIRWTPVLIAMLVASSGFGFLVLAHHWGTMAAAPVVGALGAFVAYKIAQLRAARNAPPTSRAQPTKKRSPTCSRPSPANPSPLAAPRNQAHAEPTALSHI